MHKEKASIDEAYLDFSQPVRDLIIERNPHLASVPAECPLGLDTPLPDPPLILWEPLGNVIPVLGSQDKIAAIKNDKDEEEEKACPLPPSSSQIEVASDPLNAWSDYALALAAELMQKCRADVLQQLGYTCSAGVARNKVDRLERRQHRRIPDVAASDSFQAVQCLSKTERTGEQICIFCFCFQNFTKTKKKNLFRLFFAMTPFPASFVRSNSPRYAH